MNIKNFLKPDIFKALIFLFMCIFYLYFANDKVSAAGFSFAIFYSAYGFPFQYLIIGDIGKTSGIVNNLFLGNYFIKFNNFLFNPLALALNIILIYLLACLMAIPLKNKKSKT